jgi:cytochrome b pre-mRNA-processing protein 3
VIFSKLFKSRPIFDEAVQSLYIESVKQSRQTDFYLNLEVADTVEGRFDMIILHMFIIMRRLKAESEKTEKFSQALFDLLFMDMDQNLRELGVGDMGLARRVPKMAEAFYGRIKAYEEGLGITDDQDAMLKSALDRNLYRNTTVSEESLSAMAHYLRSEINALDNISVDTLMKGQISFSPAPQKNIQGSN